MHSHPRRAAVKAVHVAVLALTLTGMAPATGLAAPLPTAAPQESFPAGIPSWYLRRILPAFLRVAPPVAPEAVPVEEPRPVSDELSAVAAGQPDLSEESAVNSAEMEQPALQGDDVDDDSVALCTDEGPSSDLFLRASVSPWLVFPGDVVTYSVVISAGERDVKDIVLVKPVPDEVEVLAAPGAT